MWLLTSRGCVFLLYGVRRGAANTDARSHRQTKEVMKPMKDQDVRSGSNTQEGMKPLGDHPAGRQTDKPGEEREHKGATPPPQGQEPSVTTPDRPGTGDGRDARPVKKGPSGDQLAQQGKAERGSR